MPMTDRACAEMIELCRQFRDAIAHKNDAAVFDPDARARIGHDWARGAGGLGIRLPRVIGAMDQCLPHSGRRLSLRAYPGGALPRASTVLWQSRSGSFSPARANSMILRATSSVMGSARS